MSAIIPAVVVFPFRFDAAMLPLGVPFGVLPATTGIDVGDEVTVRFGPFRMRFPRADVVAVETTGPYQLHKVAGPPRLSFVDRGVTFATSRGPGLCICLARPHKGPYPRMRHPALTVTVETPDALGEALLD